MSAREWKPGDVAAVTEYGAPIPAVRMSAHCGERAHAWTGDHWHYLAPMGGATWTSKSDASARPLAVIDPEDREQVERLIDSLEQMKFSLWACGAFTCMQAALREFANPKPPKPEEPSGRYAVVEDSEAREWCRIDVDNGYAWQLLGQPDGQCRYDMWRNIDVIRVLSGGVRDA